MPRPYMIQDKNYPMDMIRHDDKFIHVNNHILQAATTFVFASSSIKRFLPTAGRLFGTLLFLFLDHRGHVH